MLPLSYHATSDSAGHTPLLAISKPGANTFDLCANDHYEIEPGTTKKIWTGISLVLPIGTEGQIRTCHHLAEDFGLVVLNSPGTVPVCHQGELYVLAHNFGQNTLNIAPGEKVALLAICPIFQCLPVKVESEKSLERKPPNN